MTYLYAGLGLSMMVGILAILQYSDAILKKSINSIIPKNDYASSQYQKIDIELLNIIRTTNLSFGFNDEICRSLKFEINKSPQLNILMNEYIISQKTNSNHPDFKGSCTLTDGKHRLIISPKASTNAKYVLYSCILDKKEYCNFEDY